MCCYQFSLRVHANQHGELAKWCVRRAKSARDSPDDSDRNWKNVYLNTVQIVNKPIEH